MDEWNIIAIPFDHLATNVIEKELCSFSGLIDPI